jgi:uncharacterized membrane protein YeaQ/YmgE (transglycosylase-associated protein family)
MNLILAIVVGGVIGWIAYTVLSANRERGMRTSLFIGMFGGLLGAQLAPIFGAAASSDGNLNVFLLVIAAASAAGCLVIANMIARRSA